MRIHQAYLNTLKRYFDFEGRTGRREFWLSYLASVIVVVPVYALDAVVFSYDPFTDPFSGEFSLAPLATIYGLLVFLPFLGLIVRRLHDTGRSGWWYLILFVPIVGAVLLLVWWVTPSDPFENSYGPAPMSSGDAEFGVDIRR